MSEPKTIKNRGDLPPEVVQDFAGVRGRVQRAVQGLPRPISLEEASKQVALFQTNHPIPSK